MVSALHTDATATLRAWRPHEPAQESLRQSYLGFLAAREDACARSCVPGHLTASAVVLDEPGERVLLTLHPRVGKWLQLGGHCEPEDSSLAAAALREAREESGIEELTLDPEPLRLDVHPITCSLGVPTRHFDVQFVVRAPRGARPMASDESDDLRWWPVHALPQGTENLTELIAAALDRRSIGVDQA
ncbi:NTP pyrophosphohydrolase [Saccharomonospora marina XMU15]|uniref:NTP pyrophosphohydrolase n=1 Tax=Saccharomonospora marina XMU15 TaxID=882083 RepID=H5X9B3_9PSEU|nr:NUDIX domain-containing protein [Saccharomonospora marina]EHR49215.1 NTP pyrophosphohydrolase [Saccharomonospora marina XMU15]